ncbi:hypothetical protein EDD18DRAFT_1178435, partial [Armillaria luteobubalina]
MSATHSSPLKRLLLLFILTSGFNRTGSQTYASPISSGILISKTDVTTIYHADDGRCYDGSISGSEVTCPVTCLWFCICIAMNYFVKRNQRLKELNGSTSAE